MSDWLIWMEFVQSYGGDGEVSSPVQMGVINLQVMFQPNDTFMFRVQYQDPSTNVLEPIPYAHIRVMYNKDLAGWMELCAGQTNLMGIYTNEIVKEAFDIGATYQIVAYGPNDEATKIHTLVRSGEEEFVYTAPEGEDGGAGVGGSKACVVAALMVPLGLKALLPAMRSFRFKYLPRKLWYVSHVLPR